MNTWSTEQTVKLMEALGGYPILYDPSNKEYLKSSNCKNRTNSLKELSAILGRPIPDVEKKIKSMKCQYMREKAKRAGKSGDGAKIGKEWFGMAIMCSYMDDTAGFSRSSTSSMAMPTVSIFIFFKFKTTRIFSL